MGRLTKILRKSILNNFEQCALVDIVEHIYDTIEDGKSETGIF